MIKRVLGYILLIPLAVVLVTIGVVNTQIVELILDPFRPDAPALSVSLPFYAYLFAAVVAGVLIGSFVTWRSQARWRREARRRTAEAQRWHGEADRLARERDKMVKAQADAGLAPGYASAPANGLKQIAGGIR